MMSARGSSANTTVRVGGAAAKAAKVTRSSVQSTASLEAAEARLDASERRVLVANIRELLPGAEHGAVGSAAFGSPNYQRVRDAIRADIIAGVLPPGGRLKVMPLAQHYGLSQAPIREALNQLEAEGLIIMHPNRGAEVRRIDERYLQEIFEIRLTLEPVLAAKCVAHAEDVHVRVLTHLQNCFEAAAKKADHAEMVRLNAAFHATILGICPNVEALRLLGYHRAIMNAMRLRFGYIPIRVKHIVRDHRALIRACAARDALHAGSLLKSHIEESLRYTTADVNAAAGADQSNRQQQ
jgi:DNA-binding GntR family transcriptional regulator